MDTGELLEFRGTDRFLVERRLGSGGMGVVYQVHDREQNARVALKTLRDLDGDSVTRFKQEFRALADLSHRNLIRLGELFCERGCWFFTMELLEGQSFLTYVRPDGAGGFDETRLRAALAQLAEALSVLHSAGLVHRDIKPTNIMITPTGRLVLLDFGLVLARREPETLSTTGMVGTAAYMAPEQGTSARIGPAADWYSLGIVLYEALAGQRPFSGTPLEIAMRKQEREPLPPSAVAAGVPADLDALCQELLRRDPETRLSGDNVLGRLGVVPGKEGTAGSLPSAPPFVGRTRELQLLAELLLESRHNAVTVFIEGESGQGKSALVRNFLQSGACGEAGTLLLEGRCYEREAQPYKALDGVMDAVGRHLARLDPIDAALLLPRDVGLLVRLFPGLGKMAFLRRMPAPSVANPQELRRRAFAAVRELVSRLSDRYRIVVFIDDWQWADVDSVALLFEVLRVPEAPCVLVVLTQRGPSVAATQPKHPGDVRTLALPALSERESRDLVDKLISAAAPALGVHAEALCREAGGHPLFLQELSRYATQRGTAEKVRLDDVLWSRISALEEPAQRLLELLAVAGTPLSHAMAAEVNRWEQAEHHRVASLLRIAQLVRSTGPRGQDLLEPYPDRVREAVLAHLSDAARLAHHRGLAEALDAAGAPLEDPQLLVRHREAIGDYARAAEHAESAARLAAEGLAFDQAIEFYRIALRLVPKDVDRTRALSERLGEALANAGRGAEAAQAYLAAAEGLPEAQAVDPHRRAAEQFLLAGRIDEGMAVLKRVLATVHLALPGTPAGVLVSLALARARVRLRGLGYKRRDQSQIAKSALVRMDTCWSASKGLALIDPLRGADFQSRHLLLALQTGEPSRIARGLAGEAGFSANDGVRSRKRTARLLGEAEALAKESPQPYELGFVTTTTGIAAVQEGRWRDARDALERADVILRDACTGVAWELDTVHFFLVVALARLGELAELCRRVPVYLLEARERGDRYGIAQMRTDEAVMRYLVKDDPEGGRAEAEEAVRGFSTQAVLIQVLENLLAHGRIDLYVGDGRAAYARACATLPALRRSLLLQAQIVRVLAYDLRGRGAIAAAGTLGKPSTEGRRYLAAASADAGRLRRERAPWASALATLLDAGVAAVRGNEDRALELYAQSVARLTDVDMLAHAAAARFRQGEHLGGDQGRALCTQAESYFTDQTARNPLRMAGLYAPGPGC
jgi:tetratricopeptide (TPR) repeat protein